MLFRSAAVVVAVVVADVFFDFLVGASAIAVGGFAAVTFVIFLVAFVVFPALVIAAVVVTVAVVPMV